MSFVEALQCFQENAQVIQDPMRDPKMWNLSVGLEKLTQALLMDQQQTHQLLQTLLQEVRRR